MLFTVCLFVWDDIIDTNEHALASDFEKASVWREQSLAYFRYHLQLSPDEKVEPYCPDDICPVFKEFGQRFCARFGQGVCHMLDGNGFSLERASYLTDFFLYPAQRRRMFTKIKQFVDHNKMEQAERLAGHLPDYDQYMRVRYGVTGVRMFSLLLELVNTVY